MQHEFQPEENQTPLTANPAAPLATETETDAQAVADITKRLDEITRLSNRAQRMTMITALSFGPCIVLFAFLLSFWLRRGNPLHHFFIPLLVGVGYVGIALMLLARWRMTPKINAVELARLGGVKAIEPLFAILSNQPLPKQRRAIHAALTLLLPQMKASDAPLFNSVATQTIYRLLNETHTILYAKSDCIEIRIAALKALEQVGGSMYIPVVERLAKMRPRTLGHAKIKQAAIECLPMLLTNCGEVEAARTLLRPSHAEAARPDTLLRPASGAGQTAAQELLRPSDEESGP